MARVHYTIIRIRWRWSVVCLIHSVNGYEYDPVGVAVAARTRESITIIGAGVTDGSDGKPGPDSSSYPPH